MAECCADQITHPCGWRALCGASSYWVSLPDGNQPSGIFFREVADARQVKNRLHLDLNPGDGTLAAGLRRLTALGATVLARRNRGFGLGWVVLLRATSSVCSQVTQKSLPSRSAPTSGTMTADRAVASQAVADARSLARQALQEVRGSVRALRGDELPAPLSAMLTGLVRQAGLGEPKVTLTVAGDETAIAASARMVIFRAAQEALTNISKHSGARQVSMSVTFGDREVRLVVSDDGCGFDPLPHAAQAQPGLGLAGMRERAALAGGRAEVDSRPGSGTTVTVTIPRFRAASVVPA
jgi:two-component sensor histidine kinase